MNWQVVLPILGIVWIDLLLSGDNAVVIAMVCRQLPKRQQVIGLAFGTTAAIGLRIIMSFCAATLMRVEGLRIIGGIFLLYVAAKLVWDESEEESGRRPATSLFGAVASIAVADASMSLDNVMAIAALAKGNVAFMAGGVLLSIPFVIIGAAIIKAVVDRLPWIVWLGAGLLGWVAGSILIDDPLLSGFLADHGHIAIQTDLLVAMAAMLAVLSVGAAHRLFASR